MKLKQFRIVSTLILSLFPLLVFGQGAISEKNLRTHVGTLSSDQLAGRRTGEKGAELAAQYIENQFKQSGLGPGAGNDGYRQNFTFTPAVGPGKEKKTFSGINVIGVLPGRDPILSSEVMVFGAHYDHLGLGGQGSLSPDSTAVHHGADDNASGTSALIELARILSALKTNRRTVVFIAFSGEEEGLFGSKHYVENPLFPIEKTIAMLNMDMIGRLKDGKLTVGGIGTAKEWKSIIEEINVTRSISVPDGNKPTGLPRFNLQLSEDGFGPSDHASFYGKQIPVLFFFTGTHADYHKPSDTAEKINYTGLGDVTQYVLEIFRKVDSNTARPAYQTAKSSDQSTGRRGFSVTIGVIPGYGDDGTGMMLDGVRENSPASAAGMKEGDKVVSFAGKEIKNVQDYTAILGTLQADTEYEIVVIRKGERLSLKVKPMKR
jgi:hypothetical protein